MGPAGIVFSASSQAAQGGPEGRGGAGVVSSLVRRSGRVHSIGGGTRDNEGGVGGVASAASPSHTISPCIDSGIRVAIRSSSSANLACRPAPFRPCQGGVGAIGTSTAVSLRNGGCQ